MSYHSVDALLDDEETADQVAPEIDVSSGHVQPGDGADDPVQMDITQAPEPEPGDVALPTMAELDALVKELDEIDAILATLDSNEPSGPSDQTRTLVTNAAN